MIAACAAFSAGAHVADLRLAAHLARHEHERFVEQAVRGEVFEQCRKCAVELREQPRFQAVEIVRVRVPTACALAARGDALVFLPKHGDERNAGLHEPARHEQAGAIDRVSVALAHGERLGSDVERAGRAARRQERERFLLLADVILRLRFVIEPAPRVVERTQQFVPRIEAGGTHAAGHRECRCAEIERLIEVAIEIKRIVLEPETAGELARARERQLARLVRKRDDVRQLRVRGPARPGHAAHERPVVGIRPAVVALLLERRVRRVAGEIVIISGVMIPGRAAEIGDAMNQRKAIGLLREQRQMFAKMNLRRRRADRLELAAIFHRRRRFHVPHVDVRRAAAEEK